MTFDLAVETDFEFQSSEYRDLFACSDATGFQSPTWLSCFYSILAPAHPVQPWIVTFRQKGRLEGLVALIKRRRAGIVLLESTDLGVSDYAAPVLSPGLDEQLRADRDLQDAVRQALGAYDVLRIRPCRREHIGAWQSLTGTSPQPLGFSAHSVDLQPPFEDWRVRKMDPKTASMVARKGRRWRNQHEVSVDRLDDPDAIVRAIDELSRLRKGRFDGDPIQQEQVKSFYAQAAVQGARSGEAETWLITSDGSVASILFGLTHNGRFLYLLIGADYEAHGRHSPGLQLYEGVIEDWMQRGGTNFDFTIGDEPFKQQYGTRAEQMSLFSHTRTLKGRLARKFLRNRLVR
ncbi:CelD/BcsL family acetyltransferase involved in cellulose biosynthesis [Hoeflea halophila]|uniref:CelD/BcsL family acetyltransferase involved in cellulose biosynthesis n=1 Tax=Hoeflea halophila TaxID=714899 RepID=A0A286HM60_9HYPH|nr:GNAT family N-acetyltransferase [Hoeflea halophila]SOE08807.1 CelD/BcsL family acetyltransferase involved in cellulose biosynthesis [Hoeflea halophila]